MILLIKLAIIVSITAVLISLDGTMTLKFSGYEIYMKATTFGVLVVIGVYTVWKIARMFGWAVYVPKNFLQIRNLKKQSDVIGDVIVASLGDNLMDTQKSLKNLNAGIKDSSINKFLNTRYNDKTARITALKTIFDDGATDDKIKTIVAIELLKYDNKNTTEHILKNISKNGVLPPWVSVWQATHENDIITAKSTLRLAKSTGLSNTKYSLYEAYISAKFNEENAPEKIITAWKKNQGNQNLNSHIEVLFKATLMLEKITTKQFKICEKSIGKTKWQGASLLSVLALRAGIFGVAKDCLGAAKQMDGHEKIINVIEGEITLAKWDKTSDENKKKALEKSIKYYV